MKDATLVLLLMVVAVLAIIWWPIAVIWSINTLFRTEIPITVQTWVATALLVTLIRFNWEGSSKKSKE